MLKGVRKKARVLLNVIVRMKCIAISRARLNQLEKKAFSVENPSYFFFEVTSDFNASSKGTVSLGMSTIVSLLKFPRNSDVV